MLGREYIKIQFRKTNILSFVLMVVALLSCAFGMTVMHQGIIPIIGVLVVFVGINIYMNNRNIWYKFYMIILRGKEDIVKCHLLQYDDKTDTCIIKRDGVEYKCYAYPYAKNYVDREVNVLYERGKFGNSIKLVFPH